MKQGWQIKKLGELCESDLGKTLNQSKDTGELYPYLCAINILWDKIDFSTVKQTRFEKSELERYSVHKGDLLICEGGDIGRAAIWEKDEPMLYQNALHRVRFNGSIIPRFCLLYLRFLKSIGMLDSQYGKGVTIKHLVKSSLLSIPIPVPPIAEQEKIVAELDCLSGIIEKKKQQLKEYDALAQSIFYEMFGDPVENEKGWEMKNLGEIASEIFAGGDKPKDISSIKTDEYAYPVYANGDGDRGLLGFSKNYRVGSKAVTIGARGASVGNCRICNEKFTPVVRLITIVPSVNIDIIFLYHYVLHIEWDANGAGQAQLTTPNVVNKKVFLPPLALQQAFASKIEAIEKQKALIKKSIEEVETLFNSRMEYYFN